MKGVNWTRLSDVGQAYGATSAILSALAFGGIAVSLLVQARQAKIQKIEVIYQRHFELMRATMENPEIYAPCWGLLIGVSNVRDAQRHLFTNLILNYSQVAHESGMFSGVWLRSGIRDIFQGEIPRQYWERTRETWRATAASKINRQFVGIVDDEYEAAIANGPPPISDTLGTDPCTHPKDQHHRRHLALPAGTLVGLAGGLLIGAALRRKSHR